MCKISKIKEKFQFYVICKNAIVGNNDMIYNIILNILCCIIVTNAWYILRYYNIF
jgi:hypothetical protein